jgi:hypothetical protein
MLSIPTDQLAFLVVKARAYDAEVPPDGHEDGSNAADDRSVAALESADNPTGAELASAIDELDEDQTAELVALVFVGRGDFDAEEWEEALAEGRAQAQELGGRVAAWMLDTPNLGDLIDEGLAELGIALTGDEEE